MPIVVLVLAWTLMNASAFTSTTMVKERTKIGFGVWVSKKNCRMRGFLRVMLLKSLVLPISDSSDCNKYALRVEVVQKQVSTYDVQTMTPSSTRHAGVCYAILRLHDKKMSDSSPSPIATHPPTNDLSNLDTKLIL